MVPATSFSAVSASASKPIFSGRSDSSAGVPGAGCAAPACTSRVAPACSAMPSARTSRTVPRRKFDLPRKSATKRVRGRS